VIRYDDHAAFQIERRGIAKSWIKDSIGNPDASLINNGRASFLKCLSGRHVMLCVVTPEFAAEFVITAYFDRTKPCA
jgi:hypothetical protein